MQGTLLSAYACVCVCQCVCMCVCRVRVCSICMRVCVHVCRRVRAHVGHGYKSVICTVAALATYGIHPATRTRCFSALQLSLASISAWALNCNQGSWLVKLRGMAQHGAQHSLLGT